MNTPIQKLYTIIEKASGEFKLASIKLIKEEMLAEERELIKEAFMAGTAQGFIQTADAIDELKRRVCWGSFQNHTIWTKKADAYLKDLKIQ